MSNCWAIPLSGLLLALRVFGQSAPSVSDRPWHASGEQQIARDARGLGEWKVTIEPRKIYSLPELIDLAEARNPETRVAWERARAQAAALGVARSELYPTLVTAAISRVQRDEILFGSRFFRQTTQAFEGALALHYTVFDFGARASRIAVAQAEVLSANFGFNDTHRTIIYRVEQAYYQLLNASGQEEAARVSLANAQTVQQAAEERLKHGLATLPDVLEAKSATAQAQYDLQTIIGIEEIARGELLTGVGAPPNVAIQVQSITQVATPEAIDDTADKAIQRAFGQRPDLMQRVTEVRTANAMVREARAAFYPSANLTSTPSVQSLYGLQQTLPYAHTSGLLGGISISLNWTLFDGGARRNNLRLAEARVRGAEAQTNVTRDQIADEVWTAYANLKTAFRQREAATALLAAASQSYSAALESYNYGVRSLLDVTAAQRALAQARSADVLARTQVLTALANLAFQTADSIQLNAKRP